MVEQLHSTQSPDSLAKRDVWRFD